MTEIKLNPSQSWSVIVLFTIDLWKNRDQKFISNEESFSDYCSYLVSDPASTEDWKKVYKATFGKTLTKNDFLTPEEVFTTMIGMCAYYIYGLSDVFSELLNLFYFMRFKPEKHTKELELWQQALQKVLSGHIEDRVAFSEASP